MEKRIQQVMQERDTLGGLSMCLPWVSRGVGVVCAVGPAAGGGAGAALLSVPAIKGVEIGPALRCPPAGDAGARRHPAGR